MHQTSSVADFQPSELQPAALPLAKTREPAGFRTAYRLYWLTFFMFFASTGAGKLWDRVWHATHRFDTFWSLPHFFIFVMTAVTSILVATIAFTPRLRVWFGPTVRVPYIPFDVPGPLAILGAGLIMLSLTIMFDNFWHTAFGLDETQWSIPHDMLGWCWFTIVIGFVAARLAFRQYRPVSWITNLIIALLILEFMCPAVLGPFYLNYSPHLVRALANIPVVRGEPSAQHMYHIYLKFGLTRLTSPLFIPLVSLFAGAALVFLRKLDRRARIFLLAPLIWTCFLIARDLYTLFLLHYDGVKHIPDLLRVALKEPSLWMPIPLFVAVLAFELLQRSSFTENRVYAICGAIFALCAYSVWHTTLWMILLAIPAALTMVSGAWIGKWLYQLLEKPTFEKLIKFMLISCAQLPAILGIVDLLLRRATPWP